jgi:hypothetical protein
MFIYERPQSKKILKEKSIKSSFFQLFINFAFAHLNFMKQRNEKKSLLSKLFGYNNKIIFSKKVFEFFDIDIDFLMENKYYFYGNRTCVFTLLESFVILFLS